MPLSPVNYCLCTCDGTQGSTGLENMSCACHTSEELNELVNWCKQKSAEYVWDNGGGMKEPDWLMLMHMSSLHRDFRFKMGLHTIKVASMASHTFSSCALEAEAVDL